MTLIRARPKKQTLNLTLVSSIFVWPYCGHYAPFCRCLIFLQGSILQHSAVSLEVHSDADNCGWEKRIDKHLHYTKYVLTLGRGSSVSGFVLRAPGFKDELDSPSSWLTVAVAWARFLKLVAQSLVLRSRDSSPEMSGPALSGSGRGCNCPNPQHLAASRPAQKLRQRRNADTHGVHDRTFRKEGEG